MPRIFPPVVPPSDPRLCQPWLNRELRRIGRQVKTLAIGQSAISRGESPDASGTPLVPKGNFFVLGGTPGGQIGAGDQSASGTLKFTSTAHATKGKIHLGNPTADLTVDEAQAFIGINKSAPASTLHIVGSLSGAGSAILPSSDINSNWTARSGAGWTATGGTLFAALAVDDGLTAPGMATINVGVGGVNPQWCGLSGTIVPGATYTITFRVASLGSVPIVSANSFLACSLVDSAGDMWPSVAGLGAEAGYNGTNSPITEILTPSPTFYTITRTVVCSGTPLTTGSTPNSIRLWARCITLGPVDGYIGVTLASIAQAGASLMRWDLASGTQSGQIDIFGRMGVNTGSATLGAILDVLQGASAGVPAFRIKTEVAPTTGIYQFVITNNAGVPLAFYDSGAGDYFVAPNMFASATFAVSSDGTFGTNFTQITSGAAGIVTFNLPNVGSGGDFVITQGIQTINNKTAAATCVLISSTASSGVAFQDTSNASRKLRIVLSGAVGNNNIVIASTAARTYTFRDLSGGVVLDSGSALTSGRVPFATTGGALLDDAAFLFTVGSGLTLSAINLITDTTTGMKIGTSTSQKLGFWNAAPVAQQTTAVASGTWAAVGGPSVNENDTIDGYTLPQVVKALRILGILA